MILCWIGFLVASGFGSFFPLDGQGDERMQHAQRAVSGSSEEAKESIAFLRTQGFAGLESLLQSYDQAVDHARRTKAQVLHKEKEARYRLAIDAVAAQKDALSSRLYWHTDIEQAKKAAKTENRPLLTLRLLGRLDEELSCANSRFFRTALYADPEISQFLRENFVLHWQSVRPVPVVTIDYGDGRKLRRTITGNSVHFVLDPEGVIVDSLPGLYSPKPFLETLKSAQQAISQEWNLREAKLRAARSPLVFPRIYQVAKLRQIEASWRKDLAAIEMQGSKVGEGLPLVPPASASVDARTAAPRAVAKTGVEWPMLDAISFRKLDELAGKTEEDFWPRIAALHAGDAKLSEPSVEMIRGKVPAEIASALSVTKMAQEDPVLRTVRNFESAMALDTVRNQYLFRSRILRWLIEDEQAWKPRDGFAHVDSLAERVYAELFLTPSSDPWLGLLPPDTYSALDRGGILESR